MGRAQRHSQAAAADPFNAVMGAGRSSSERSFRAEEIVVRFANGYAQDNGVGVRSMLADEQHTFLLEEDERLIAVRSTAPDGTPFISVRRQHPLTTDIIAAGGRADIPVRQIAGSLERFQTVLASKPATRHLLVERGLADRFTLLYNLTVELTARQYDLLTFLKQGEAVSL